MGYLPLIFKFFFYSILILETVSEVSNSVREDSSCVCQDQSLCAAIKVGPRQEVYGFSTNTENWKHWDFDKLTTISIFGKWDKELLCYAHSKVSKESSLYLSVAIRDH